MRSLFVTGLIAAGSLLYYATTAAAGCGPGCHVSALGAFQSEAAPLRVVRVVEHDGLREESAV